MARAELLIAFGKYIKNARLAAGLTQAQAATCLTKTSFGKGTQSLIAQLELGKVSKPKDGFFKALGDLYNIDLGEIWAQFMFDKYKVDQLDVWYDAGKRYPTFAGVSGLQVCCKVSKAELPPVIAGEDIFQWSVRYPNLKLLWLWVAHFANHHSDRALLRQAVQKLIQNGTKATFFVNPKEAKQGAPFWTWQQHAAYGSGMVELFQEKTAVIPVPELALMNTQDVMLANPHIGPTHGICIFGQMAVELCRSSLADNMKMMLCCADEAGAMKQAFL